MTSSSDPSHGGDTNNNKVQFSRTLFPSQTNQQTHYRPDLYNAWRTKHWSHHELQAIWALPEYQTWLKNTLAREKPIKTHMNAASISLIVAGSAILMVMGGRYLMRAVRTLKPGQGIPITDVNEAVEKYRHKFYEGGFEKQMTKREAALILGCRESAAKERIMDRFRMLAKKNHPDLGGSPHLSAKVNEAKDMLIKTARSENERS